MTYTLNITQEYLNECFLYDPETGDLFKKIRPQSHFKNAQQMNAWNAKNSGKKAGTVCTNWDGYKYVSVSINNKNYLMSHVIWLMMTGCLPSKTIDHKNCDSLDNRWVNLRLANKKQQAQNRKSPKNKLKGVFTENGKYVSAIEIFDKKLNLGKFLCPAAASFAYQIAADIHFGDFARAF